MIDLTSLSRAIFILGSMVIMAAIILNVVIAILEQGGMFTLGALPLLKGRFVDRKTL